jgi:Ni,Fe-hydrogenase I small subunit
MAEKVSSITKAPAVSDVHILWITAGLSCDGDSVSVTAAEQPSIEDVLLGAIPGLPKVHLHNPVLAYENGDEFMKFFYEAEKGLLDPFVLVVEGSIPNEKIKKEGYWAAMGTRTRASRLQPASGSIAWPRRLWLSSARERVPPTAASTQWRETRRGAWGWPTTLDGIGVPRPVCPL